MPRVIAFSKSGSAYEDSFYRAFEAAGGEAIYGEFGGRWLARHLRRGDVVHLHWPSFAYKGSGRRGNAVWRFLRFAALVIFCRIIGGRIFWTAHNLLPHDRSPIPLIDIVGRWLIIGLAERIFVHGRNALAALSLRFPTVTEKAVQIPHGHWIDRYPVSNDREQVREEFGVRPDTFAYLFFGFCKPYKNLDGLIEVFRRIPGDAILIVAGRFQDAEYRERILTLAQLDSRVKVISGFIADAEIHKYFLCADAFVAPYREVLTSGTTVLAMGFGCPVVSVRQGFLMDVVDERCGILFDRTSPDELEDALRRARSCVWDRPYIRSRIANFTFETAANTLLRHVQSR